MSVATHDRARDLVNKMEANGASFVFQPVAGALPNTFTYSLPRGGDRWKCRALIGEAKADAALWSAVVAEIERRCRGGAE